MRLTSLFATTVVALSLAGTAHAMPGGPHEGHGGGHGGMHEGAGPQDAFFAAEEVESLAVQLGVDAKTLQKIKDLVYAANKEAIDLRADLQRGHLDLREMLDQDQPDAAKVMAKVDTLTASEGKMRKNRIQLLLSVRALLTPPQRTQLRQLLMQRRGAGMGAGANMPPPVGP
jgi:Spy/CpxP family protein refolding chaperone